MSALPPPNPGALCSEPLWTLVRLPSDALNQFSCCNSKFIHHFVLPLHLLVFWCFACNLHLSLTSKGRTPRAPPRREGKVFLCLSDITGKKRISERSPLHRNPGGRKDLFPILSLIVGFRTRAGQVRTYSCPGHNSWYWIMKFHYRNWR